MLQLFNCHDALKHYRYRSCLPDGYRLYLASIDIAVRVSNAGLHGVTCLLCFVCILQQQREPHHDSRQGHQSHSGGFLAAETVNRQHAESADVGTPCNYVPYAGNSTSHLSEIISRRASPVFACPLAPRSAQPFCRGISKRTSLVSILPPITVKPIRTYFASASCGDKLRLKTASL